RRAFVVVPSRHLIRCAVRRRRQAPRRVLTRQQGGVAPRGARVLHAQLPRGRAHLVRGCDRDGVLPLGVHARQERPRRPSRRAVDPAVRRTGRARGPLRAPAARRRARRRARGPRPAGPDGPDPRRVLGDPGRCRRVPVTSLTGWGRTQPSVATVVTPANERDVLDILSRVTSGVIARGLGRSYGDAAQVAGGTVIDGLGLGGFGPIDEATGEVTVGAGASIDALLATSVPKGWFIAVSPGTRQVTIGGAIAADVHGKNHHRDGAFCQHVGSLRLVTPPGAGTRGAGAG